MLNKKFLFQKLLPVIYLLFFCSTVNAAIDPKLVGVWDNFQVDRIYEFRSDGSWLGWTFKGSNGTNDFQYTLIRDLKITMLSKNKFQITKKNKQADNIFQMPYRKDNKTVSIIVGQNGFKIEELGKIREYRKRAFNFERTGNYQLHLNFAFDALLRQAIKAKNSKQLKNLLSSSKADFLKKKYINIKVKSGKMSIYPRLWQLAIKSKNTKLVSVLIKSFPRESSERFITLAKELKDKKMVALLNKANGINIEIANGATAVAFKRLSQLHEWADSPIEYQKKILKRNCFLAPVLPSVERDSYAKAAGEERGYWYTKKLGLLNKKKNKNKYKKFRRSDPKVAFSRINVTAEHTKAFESTLRSCLNNFQKKGERISQSLLDGTFNRGTRDTDTPLYNYASIGSVPPYKKSTSFPKTVLYRYTVVKILLEFGANPDIKPRPDYQSLAAYMYSGAPHKRFAYLGDLNKMIQNAKYPQPKIQYQADLILAEINLYNDIMKKIGGHPYRANDTSYQNENTKTTLKSNKPQINNKKIVSPKKPKIKTKVKIKNKPQLTAKVDALSGCWNWSNGPKIIITKDGLAKNGVIPAKWKTVDSKNNRYSITWPSITDSVTLSVDGSSYSGKNIFGFPVSAKRISGKSNSIQGKWLSNNIELTLAANKTATAAHLKGAWKKHGNGYVIEWPIIDDITVSKNKNTLTGKNQFGAFTAKRDKNCKTK